jgi:predicted GH43/DUF377 family glycosyl hydrolase
MPAVEVAFMRHSDCSRPVSARRLSDTPVVAFGSVPGYGPIFNAGVIETGGLLHLFARGVREGYIRNGGPGPRFLEYVSDVLVFTSIDGIDYRFQRVLAASSADGVHSYEDPRVQRVRSGGREHVIMTYTHLPHPASGRPWRVGVHRLVYRSGRFGLNRTSGRIVGADGHADKDAVIFNLRDGRVALLHRIHPNVQLAVFDSLDDLYTAGPAYWDEHMRELERHTVLRPRPGALGIGAGAPPVPTEAGLLLFYHERNSASQYSVNAALLDHASGRVRAVLSDPILRPERPWECEGDVDDVVFVQGAVPRADGTIYLTYGAADSCVGAATVRTDELVEALLAAA